MTSRRLFAYTADMSDDTSITVSPNHLLELHRNTEAEYQPYGDIEIVSTFGAPQAEYAALHKNCGLIDWPQRGILELTGPDRLEFLNNLITNQTWDKQTKTPLEAGMGVYAYLLNAKGRLEADMNVLELGERTWLEMDIRLIEMVRQVLDRHLFTEKVTLTSRVGQLHEISLEGPDSLEVAQEILDQSIGELPPIGSKALTLPVGELVVWRDDPAGAPGHHLIAEPAIIQRLWEHMFQQFQDAPPGRRPLRPVGWAAWNSARIEAGRPLFGIDFDNSILPAETARFEQAVNLNKGCYLGQEIVARMHARNVVAKKQVGVRIDGGELPMAGVKVFDDQQNEIGGITSSTPCPLLQHAAIGIALLKRGYTEPGRIVHVPAEGAMREAEVVTMPFLPPRNGSPIS